MLLFYTDCIFKSFNVQMNHFNLQITFVTVHNTCHLFNNVSSTVRSTVLATNEEL
jgi:hypothetical protein